MDKAWEQKKTEARKMFIETVQSHLPKRSEGVYAVSGGW